MCFQLSIYFGMLPLAVKCGKYRSEKGSLTKAIDITILVMSGILRDVLYPNVHPEKFRWNLKITHLILGVHPTSRKIEVPLPSCLVVIIHGAILIWCVILICFVIWHFVLVDGVT